jgi:hypothetical protein
MAQSLTTEEIDLGHGGVLLRCSCGVPTVAYRARRRLGADLVSKTADADALSAPGFQEGTVASADHERRSPGQTHQDGVRECAAGELALSVLTTE